MACTEPTQAELMALLAEAKAAYHSLMTGQALVEIRDQNGEMVRYSQINRQALYSYIQELERKVCQPSGARSSRPMGFFF